MIIQRALISVSDKIGIVDLARGLHEAGVSLVSSGGTHRMIYEADIPVTRVTEVTGAPEFLDGRVKTLHPRIHGGILADRRKEEHTRQLEEQDIQPIDLVVCNLYPFEKTIAADGVSEDDAIEQIDIGGPAMVRAAAKNFHSVAVVVSPDRYDEVLDHVATDGEIPLEVRRSLALEAFNHTAGYDSAIAGYLSGETFPETLQLTAAKVSSLRYGENPHQDAAFYGAPGDPYGLAAAEQLHGKELSYNNLLDTDAAWRLVQELPSTGCAIIKHSNPCGAAIAESISEAYGLALDCDRTSAFGGIVALNRQCDAAAASAISEIFTEVVIAPGYEPEALEILKQKKNVRILAAQSAARPSLDVRSVAGGFLLQTTDGVDDLEAAKVVTKVQPTEEQMRDLRFAWVIAKHVKSNAIVLAKDGVAVGVGAGQMSRVESTKLAAMRAGDRAAGTACASDAFFPFRDGLDAAVQAGAAAVIQPGGSVRDEEVIAAADEHGIPMVFTGRRHFKH